MNTTHPLIARNMYKIYGNKTIVHNLSFELNKGGIYGLLGSTGSGKTTVLKMLLGLTSITKGDAYIHGHCIHLQKHQALRRVGALIDSPYFYPYLTGEEHLRYFAKLYDIPYDIPHIEAILADLNLGRELRSLVSRYPYGLKQKLGIALALLPQPSVLILDEPFNGMDDTTITALIKNLKKLAHKHGTTILMSSVSLEELQQVCDTVYVLEKGTLVDMIDVVPYPPSEKKVTISFQVTEPTKAMAVLDVFGATTLLDHKVAVEGYFAEVPRMIQELCKNDIHIYQVVQENPSFPPLENHSERNTSNV